MDEPTPSRGAAAWLLRWLPQMVAQHSERVLLNFGVMLIGVSALTSGPHHQAPALAHLWPFPLYEWAMTMLVGGGGVLLGMATHKRSIERLGMILVAGGCLFYAGLLLWVFHWPAAITSIIFLAIAAAKIIRLVVTSAVRTNNIQQLTEQLREPPAPPGCDR